MRPKIIKLKSGRTVETWFDQPSKQWVTQLKDVNGNQIGEALVLDARGNRAGVRMSRLIMIEEDHKMENKNEQAR